MDYPACFLDDGEFVVQVGRGLTLRPDEYVNGHWIIEGKNDLSAATCSTDELREFCQQVLAKLTEQATH